MTGHPDRSDYESGFAYSDPGHVVAMCSAAAGWWAVYGPPGNEFRSPVAVWIVTEAVTRYAPGVKTDGGRLGHHHTVYGVDPTGKGWDGTPIEQDVEYRYEPDWPD